MKTKWIKTISRRSSWMLLALAGVVGCMEPEILDAIEDRIDRNGSPQSSIDTRHPPLSWGECPDGLESECALLTVPLQWRGRSWETIDVWISRRPAQGISKGQLWLLDGGPGGDSAGLSQAVDGSSFGSFNDYDLYVLQHRGTGDSTRLSCPDQEDPTSLGGIRVVPDELPDCVAYLQSTWGEGLKGFNATNAARDLVRAIRRTRERRQKVFIYGLSYGTLWAQRFLQIAPRLASGVVLDSVLPPVGISVFDYDKQFDPVAQDLASLCDDDVLCSSKLGADSYATIQSVLNNIDQGHCSDLGLNSTVLGELGSALLTSDQLRRHLFPVFYRINRCDAQDIVVVGNFLQTLNMIFGPPPTEVGGFSPLLQYNILFPEVVEEPVQSFPDVLQDCIDADFCPFFSVNTRSIYDGWPISSAGRFANKWFNPKIPVLAMNGTLDPQTPLDRAATIVPHLDRMGQSFVSVPGSPHIVLFRAPDADPMKPTCGVQMILSFLNKPRNPVDTSCLDSLLGVVFDIPDPEAAFFYGQPDEWENAAPRGNIALHHSVDVHALAQRIRNTPSWKMDRKLFSYR